MNCIKISTGLHQSISTSLVKQQMLLSFENKDRFIASVNCSLLCAKFFINRRKYYVNSTLI